MKLTLILDGAAAGVRASLVEEWDNPDGPARMDPMIRHFDADEQAVVWARVLARRRGVGQIYLTDNRKAASR